MGSSESRNILHVDDDPAILRLVSKKLRSFGYNVISVQNPLLVLETLKLNSCSVVLSDIEMPELDGLDLLKQIKKADGGIQVIMLTGVVSIATVLQSMRWGAEACTFKPIDNFDDLVAHIDRAFSKIAHWRNALFELKALKYQSVPAVPESVSVPLSGEMDIRCEN